MIEPWVSEVSSQHVKMALKHLESEKYVYFSLSMCFRAFLMFWDETSDTSDCTKDLWTLVCNTSGLWFAI